MKKMMIKKSYGVRSTQQKKNTHTTSKHKNLLLKIEVKINEEITMYEFKN